MSAQFDQATFRKRLLQITLNKTVDEHPAMIEALRAEVPHTVAVMQSEYPLDRYTCGMHAFHLVEDPTYLSVADTWPRLVYAGLNFIHFLRENGLLRPRPCAEVLSNDLVIYLEKGQFRHVGRTARRAIAGPEYNSPVRRLATR